MLKKIEYALAAMILFLVFLGTTLGTSKILLIFKFEVPLEVISVLLIGSVVLIELFQISNKSSAQTETQMEAKMAAKIKLAEIGLSEYNATTENSKVELEIAKVNLSIAQTKLEKAKINLKVAKIES